MAEVSRGFWLVRAVSLVLLTACGMPADAGPEETSEGAEVLGEASDALSSASAIAPGEWGLAMEVIPPSGELVRDFRAVGSRIATLTSVTGSTSQRLRVWRRTANNVVSELSYAVPAGTPFTLNATTLAVATTIGGNYARVRVHRLDSTSVRDLGVVLVNQGGGCPSILSVALAGDSVIVGCSNATVRVFEPNAARTAWTFSAAFSEPATSPYPIRHGTFGDSLAANGRLLLVSRSKEARDDFDPPTWPPKYCGPGRVHVYAKTNGQWAFARTLVGDIPELECNHFPLYRYGSGVEVTTDRVAIQVGSDYTLNGGHTDILSSATFARLGSITTQAQEYIGFSGRTFVKSDGEVYEPMGQLGWLMSFEALESADRVAAPTHSRVVTRSYDGTLHIYEKAPLEVGQAVAQ